MDTELLLWMLFFMGGYSAVVGYLLWIVLRKGDDPDTPTG
jgi:hypothetical protein